MDDGEQTNHSVNHGAVQFLNENTSTSVVEIDLEADTRSNDCDENSRKVPDDHAAVTNEGYNDAGDEEISSSCSICMEDWTIGTEHRVCSLKCGHLFGRSCIERWIKDQGSNAKCPNCNKQARKADIRNLWCKAIKATDSTEVSELKRQIDNEFKQRRLEQGKLYNASLKLDLAQADIERLKKELEDKTERLQKLQAVLDKIIAANSQLRTDNDSSSSNIEEIIKSAQESSFVRPVELKGSFQKVRFTNCSASGGCKAIAISTSSSLAVVSQPTPGRIKNPFGDFGLRKYSIADVNAAEFIPLHAKHITSFDLKQASDLALTGSADKRVKITSLTNNVCVQHFETEFEPNCVSWSTNRQHQFYVGYSNCYVALFDTRNTHEPIYQTSRVANTRLLSGASIGQNESTLNGFVMNDIKGCHFLEVSDASVYDDLHIDLSVDHMYHNPLPYTGFMGTVDYDLESGCTLVSTRPNSTSPNCAHNLMKLEKIREDDEEDAVGRIEAKVQRIFVGGTSSSFLTQSRILRHPTMKDSVLVASHDEQSSGIKIWDASDNTVFQTIPSDTIRDISMVSSEPSDFLLFALSDKNMSMYRWQLG